MIVDAELSRARFERDVRGIREEPAKYQSIGINPVEMDFPKLLLELDWYTQSRKLLLLVETIDWDYRAPLGSWVDADGGAKLHGIPVNAGFQVAPNPRGVQRPWFCFPGWREYHEHPGHQQPTWASVRGRVKSLMGLVAQLHADLNKPGVTVHG